MCGLAGYANFEKCLPENHLVLAEMADSLNHRGPDNCGYFADQHVGFGFRRLNIIDIEGGNQPLFSEDDSVVLMCNGEIFNYKQLRRDLQSRGHVFATQGDIEVLVHLYEERGIDLVHELNGQFAFAIYDRRDHRVFLARDHFGINPMFYTMVDSTLIFGSEIKAILKHPAVTREVDLTGLDQILCFPGLVSPRTMFKGIKSLASGHFLELNVRDTRLHEYWDLDYPREGELRCDKPEDEHIAELRDHFTRSVRYRLQSDVPVGFYLSGGLDSSLIGATMRQVDPSRSYRSFSITFPQERISETRYQRFMSEGIQSRHQEIIFDWLEIASRMKDMVYHCECPVKETYNTCSLALSEAAKRAGVTVILTGEGADELFAGYVGYRFDQFDITRTSGDALTVALEEEMRERLWGDRNLFYETNYHGYRELRSTLYAEHIAAELDEFDCLNASPVNKDRLVGRHPIHQRSYLDFKLRMADHLISDHGDRMALANSVEARYPFLDIELVELARHMPPCLKLRDYQEKYILKRAAEALLPQCIIEREKFGFHAPGSPYLLQQGIEWVNDLLSYDQIARQGYFNPETIERLKQQYGQSNFELDLPFESDLLIIVLSFSVFLERFELSYLN